MYPKKKYLAKRDRSTRKKEGAIGGGGPNRIGKGGQRKEGNMGQRLELGKIEATRKASAQEPAEGKK